MCIRSILEKHETELVRFRHLLFPFIAKDVITGFNVYEKQEPFSDAPIIISHLHTELDDGRSYRSELETRIRNCCESYKVQKVRFEKIDRHTAYKLLEDWEADEYYDSFGNPINKKELEELLTAGMTVIGGGIQSDMKIAVENTHQLHAVLEELRCYFNKFRIDKDSGYAICKDDGRVELNPEAVPGSWEVPVILVKSEFDTNLSEAYPRITEVKINKPEYFLDILVHQKEELLRNLFSQLLLDLEFGEVNANRIFVEYIDGNLKIKK
jgi:hypothetical protein